MASPAVNDSFLPTPSELLNQMLSDVRFGAARRGIVANVSPGSELHERFTAVANRLSIAFENTRLALAAVNPLDARAVLDPQPFGAQPRVQDAGSLPVFARQHVGVGV